MSRDGKYLQLYEQLIGCDEAGRGPLAGPVIGCAVGLRRENKNLLRHLKKMGVGDSKKLSSQKRQEILKLLQIDTSVLELRQVYARSLKGHGFEFALEQRDNKEIDRLNILQASLSCMRAAASEFGGLKNAAVVVDGNKSFAIEAKFVEAVVKGDHHFLCVSLASIIAKEFRDEKMRSLALLYPGYGLEKHAGYPTKEHRAAIGRLGISPVHRLSFKGVKEHVHAFQGREQRKVDIAKTRG